MIEAGELERDGPGADGAAGVGQAARRGERPVEMRVE
jgi:hypothetical protein